MCSTFQTRLESYRALQSSGKDLNADQKTAVAKYDEVIQTLEFAKDLCKQFLSIAAVSEKEAKKQARKEAAARSQSELAKVIEGSKDLSFANLLCKRIVFGL